MAHEELIKTLRAKAAMDKRKVYLAEAADVIEFLERRCNKEIPLVGKKVRLLESKTTNGGDVFNENEALEVVEHMGLMKAPNSSALSIRLQDPSNHKRVINLLDTALLLDGKPILEIAE